MILIFAVMTEVGAAEEFGRFFTTPMQRQYLDQLKNRPPEIRIEIDDDDIEVDVVDEAEIVRDSVTLKGLVYRSNGKSVAWINDSNTYEGDTASGYIDIPEGKISPSQVTIKMQGQEMEVGLKVGQQYEPKTDNVEEVNNKLPEKFSTGE